MAWVIEFLSRLFRNGVSKEICAEVQRKNAVMLQNLEDCIEGAEKRTGERFVELKSDMRHGFDEVKQLIRDKQ